MSSYPPESLRIARRSLQALEDIEEIGEWVFVKSLARWSLDFSIVLRGDHGNFPECTDWIFVVTGDYPYGRIIVVPDAESGITETYPHQRANLFIDTSVPWRLGSICTGTQLQHFGRYALTEEPWTAFERLKWYAEGALRWVRSAASETLSLVDDPFESPSFDSIGKQNWHFAFQEDASTFLLWMNSDIESGIVDLSQSSIMGNVFQILRFWDNQGRVVVRAPWRRRRFESSENGLRGAWIRLPAPPSVPPYGVPSTMGELESVMKSFGLGLWEILEPIVEKVRGKAPFVLMLGFPVKMLNSDDWSAIQWQAVVFDPLSHGTQTTKGFRNGSTKGRWIRDRRTTLTENTPLDWQPTANWATDAITSRGRLPIELANSDILIIGAGSLGSLVAEQLVRGGVSSITIVDDDELEIGNLVRHTLTAKDLHRRKAVSLAEHLNAISPNVDVVALVENFTPDASKFGQYDIVLDTTGSDEVAYALAETTWEGRVVICSMSLGYKAKRLYFYGYKGQSYPAIRFLELIAPLETEDYGSAELQDLPREGPGCFNPVFPARDDDFMLLASCAVKEIDQFVREETLERLATYKQIEELGIFAGVHREDHDLSVARV